MTRRPDRRFLVQPLLYLLAFGLCLATAGQTRAGDRDTVEPELQSTLTWPMPPSDPRIRYLRTYTGSADFRRRRSRLRRILIGPEKQHGITLRKPYGVTVDRQGRIYVTDTGTGHVVVFDLDAGRVRRLKIDPRLKLKTPIGIQVDQRGRVFVSDAELDQVFRIGAGGAVELALGRMEGLENPTGIALDEERGRLYVADSHLHQVLVYDSESGNHLATWGHRGSGDGAFNFPTNLALDGEGRLYVVDTGNFRVQVFSADGGYLRSFGGLGDSYGSFSRPKGIGIDPDGNVYVVDAAFNNFQIFDQQGRLLLFVGSLGRGNANFWLPAGLHIDSNGKIYIVDQVNRRLQVFEYLPPKSGAEPREAGLVRHEETGGDRRTDGARPSTPANPPQAKGIQQGKENIP